MKTRQCLIAVTAALILSGLAQPAFADQTIVVATGTTNTTGIATNGGNDTITVETNAAVLVTSTGATSVVAVNPGGGTNLVLNQGAIHAEGTIAESTNANLDVVALMNSAGWNTVTNTGALQSTATIGADPVFGTNAISAHATATGLAAGHGDTVVNTGTISATADTTLTRGDPLTIGLLGWEVGTNSTTAEATATGVAGGSGATTFTSDGSVTATATAEVHPVAISLTLEDGAAVDASVNANATATAIAGGTGTSSITNNGSVTASATADVGSTSIGLTLANAVTADASLNAHANATGIAGGAGVNQIHNASQIVATALAEAHTVGVNVSFDAVARGDTTLTPTAQAHGITGGTAGDFISNDGSITSAATSDASRVGVSVAIYDFTFLQELLDASADNTINAQATAFGMNGGLGNDLLANSGSISVNATSTVFALDVSLSSEGIPPWSQVTNVVFGNSIAALDRIAEAGATGMTGGEGDDSLLNAGSLTASAHADSSVNSVTVGFALPSIPLDFLPGIPIATAGSSNRTVVIGMDAGAGNDFVFNTNGGVMTVNSTADVTTVGVAAQLDVGLGTFPVSISVPLVNSRTDADTVAAGIGSGDGDDSVRNAGTMNTTASADALSVVASLNVAFTGKGVGVAVPVADASTRATATATGISGGAGNDTLINEATGRSTVNATSDANSWLVSADIAGTTEGLHVGVPLASASVLSEATATGINSGNGNNTVRNEGYLSTKADAEADNVVASLGVTGTAEGVAIGVSVADATTTARANATGILGGTGSDAILNTAGATNAAAALSDVQSVGVAVNIIGPTEGLAVSVGRVEANTLAVAHALGISGDDGLNVIRNSGLTTAHAGATNLNIGVGVGVTVTLDTGLGLAGAQVLAGSEARVESTGISAGNGGSSILNEGTITTTAETKAQTVSVTVAANIGIGAGGFDSDASTVANSIATGIQGGGGIDFITNSSPGNIAATAKSEIKSGAVGVNISIVGGGLSDASATATNVATGIAGGGGQDTISNEGHISATADARGTATSFTFGGLVGAGVAKAGTTAEATASGIDGGDDADVVRNSGTLDVLATIDLDAGAISVTAIGYSVADATATSRATALGLSGGGGGDFIANSGSVNLGTVSALDVSAKTFQLAGFASAKVAETTANALATGLGGGDGNDWLVNDGRIAITLAGGQPMAQAIGRSTAWNLFGATDSDVVLSANVNVVGMAGGNGNDTIVNRGTNIVGGPLSGTAMAKVDASGSSWTFGGAASVGVVATATTESTGLSGGAGNDWLSNEGRLEVSATAQLISLNGASATFGDSSSSAQVTANSTATGLSGGDGDDQMFSTGSSVVTSRATCTTTNSSDTGFLFGQGHTISDGKANATACGATLGSGKNELNHGGQTEVLATPFVSSYSYSDGGDIWNGNASSSAYSKVTAMAVGLSAEDGENNIRNSGMLSVRTQKAGGDEALAVAHAVADGDGLDGDGWGNAVATADSTSIGIQVGNGAHDIANSGSITVSAEPTTSAKVNIDGDNTGNATGITESTATGVAMGINTGNGDGQINNSGVLAVTAAATANVSASVGGGWLGSSYLTRTASASASAAGIATGDGNHQITNSGTIAVEARADSNYGGASLSATAVGIQTGDGDDTIVNSGSISATNHVGTTRTLGTAIHSGGGNDRIHLVGGSTTIGSLNAGAGTDTLVLDGAGSYGLDGSGSLLGFENSIKIGTGRFTLGTGVPTMDRLEMVAGVLELNGNYTFKGTGGDGMPDGYFGAWVNGNGSNGQLLVLGQADLDGNITIARGPGPFAIGVTTFDVLVASNGVVNSFTSTNLPDARPLLSFDVNQLSDRVQAEAVALSFTTVARNKVELAVAGYLDTILPGSSGDLALVLDTVQQLTEPEFPTAFSSLSPDSYDAFTRATFATVWQHSKSMQQRLGTLRSVAANRNESQASAFQMPKPALLAYAGDDLGGVISREQQQARQNPNGIWADTFGQWSDQQGENGYTGFDYNVWGVTLGYDRAVNDRLTLGLSGAYAATDVNLDGNRGSGDIESFSGSAYGSYAHNNLHLEGVLSYGFNSYDNQRNLEIGPITRLAWSSHDGQALGAFVSGGYAWEWKRWTIEPFVSLQYTHLDEDAFSETGAGDVSLAVAERTTDSLVSELGLLLARVIRRENFTCIPEVSLAWNYDYAIDDRVLTASFAGSPGASFSLPGQDVEPHGLTTGAGLTFLFKEHVGTSLRYKGEFRNNYSAHAVVGEVRFTF
jgi:uncharacterized protein with beta-barrel porin domain